MRWRVKGGSVISPSEASGKFRDRHDLQKSDLILRQPRQEFARSVPRAFASECSDMHFINDPALEPDTFPCFIIPAIQKRIHDLRRAMRSLGLKSGCRIGKEPVPAVKAKPILHARPRELDGR